VEEGQIIIITHNYKLRQRKRVEEEDETGT